MTDLPPPDDELVSAYLDGELPPDEAARLSGDPAFEAARHELEAVRARVGEPVVPPPGARDTAVAAALDLFDQELGARREADGRGTAPGADAFAPAAGGIEAGAEDAAATVTSLAPSVTAEADGGPRAGQAARARRRRRRMQVGAGGGDGRAAGPSGSGSGSGSRRALAPWLAGAAAVVLVAVVAAAGLRQSSRSTSGTSAEVAASGSAATTPLAGAGADAHQGLTSPAPPSTDVPLTVALGELADAQALGQAVASRLSPSAASAHPPSTTTAGADDAASRPASPRAESAPAGSTALPPDVAACVERLRAADADNHAVVLVGPASYQHQPVTVVAFALPSPPPGATGAGPWVRVLAVDAGSCAVVATTTVPTGR